jgi:hypothetical protein
MKGTLLGLAAVVAAVLVSAGSSAGAATPNPLHLARNDGTKPVTLYAMYLGIPKGEESNSPEQAPAGCNA